MPIKIQNEKNYQNLSTELLMPHDKSHIDHSHTLNTVTSLSSHFHTYTDMDHCSSNSHKYSGFDLRAILNACVHRVY